MRTEAQIQAEIDEKNEELAVVRAEMAKRAALPEDKRLAIDLHNMMCHASHTDAYDTDACGWSYSDSWTESSHSLYLAKARKALLVTEMSAESIAAVIRAVS